MVFVAQKKEGYQESMEKDDIGLECHFRFAEMYGANSVKPEFGRCPLNICIWMGSSLAYSKKENHPKG